MNNKSLSRVTLYRNCHLYTWTCDSRFQLAVTRHIFHKSSFAQKYTKKITCYRIEYKITIQLWNPQNQFTISQTREPVCKSRVTNWIFRNQTHELQRPNRFATSRITNHRSQIANHNQKLQITNLTYHESQIQVASRKSKNQNYNWKIKTTNHESKLQITSRKSKHTNPKSKIQNPKHKH